MQNLPSPRQPNAPNKQTNNAQEARTKMWHLTFVLEIIEGINGTSAEKQKYTNLGVFQRP